MSVTPLEYMEKQLKKHISSLVRESARGAPEEVLRNIEAKICYYQAAVEALIKDPAD